MMPAVSVIQYHTDNPNHASLSFINKTEIWRYAGFKGSPSESDDRELTALMDEVIAEALPKISYRVCFCTMPIDTYNKADTFSVFHASNGLKKLLLGCDNILFFAATLGIELDRMMTRYERLSPTKALLLQAFGAERIEALCDFFCLEYTKKIQKDSHTLTRRFSPGYGDLDLSAQRFLLQLLDTPRKIGLSLNESLLMSPIKSVSAICGIKETQMLGGASSGTTESANPYEHSCSQCTMENCANRKEAYIP